LAKVTVVKKNRYLDSVFLMLLARRIAARPGITDASAVLGTAANLAVLAGMGYGGADFAAAGANDLVLALEGEPDALEAVAADAEAWLAQGSGTPGSAVREPRTVAEAVAQRPDSSLAVISVPGEHAAREARAALRAGLHVFLFSSNVPLAEEVDLKTEAAARGLIVMGPDCGTAYLGGAGVGFANAVRRGPIGIVGSTGTGMQEFSCLVHQAGSGLSAGIGTGSRDLSDAVGGRSTLAAIEALEADPETRVVTVLAKPPDPAAAARLRSRLDRCAKPVVLCLLGAEPGRSGGNVRTAATIDGAARLALEAVGLDRAGLPECDGADLRTAAAAQVARMGPRQRWIRGLFSGGTLCYQAQAIFRQAGLKVHANAPLEGMPELSDPHCSVGDTFVDLGAEIFVQGRPHPMIDGTQRRRRLEQEAEDPEVALVLLDFILGAISSRDPVGDLLGAVRGAQEAARRRGGHLCVAASVCGTDQDAQGLQAQVRALAEAGVLVFHTAAQAAAFCREAMVMLRERKEVY
jgi:succinyl-CoA synthetase alpha subunit